MSVTVDDVLRVFGGGIVVNLDLQCVYCGPKARIIKAVWPHFERWQCHFCGREATPRAETRAPRFDDAYTFSDYDGLVLK